MKKIILLFFIFIIYSSVFPRNWFVYKPYNTGLPNDFIHSLAIDANENLRSGTSAGLFKYDVNRWVVYDTIQGFTFNEIYSITINGDGNKWVGTNKGIVNFDNINWTNYTEDNSGFPFDVVFSISINGSGNKWIGTIDYGLAVYKEGGVVSIESNKNNISPTYFMLYQNYHNPFKQQQK